MVEIARTLNPHFDTVVRTHSEEEAELLVKEKSGKIFIGEHLLATIMFHYLVARIKGGTRKIERD